MKFRPKYRWSDRAKHLARLQHFRDFEDIITNSRLSFNTMSKMKRDYNMDTICYETPFGSLMLKTPGNRNILYPKTGDS